MVAGREGYLSSKHIQSKPVEAADYSLLNVQPKVVQSPHGGEQETWSPSTEHVNVNSSSFPEPNLHLQDREIIPKVIVFMIDYLSA